MTDLRQPSHPTALRRHTPVEVDNYRPSAARMYDYYLGGTHHLAADREAADALRAAVPDVAAIARADHSFMRRVVGYAASCGIDQFLDLGAGYPLAGGVPDVVRSANPDATVVAVDIDAEVVAATQTAISANGLGGRVGAVHADLRDPASVLAHPVTRRLIDLERPVAVLCLSVLHFVGGDLGRVLGPLRTTMAGGGLLALSHATTCGATTPHGLDREVILRLIYDCTLTPLSFRTEAELHALLAGLPLAEPGLVPVELWRPAGPAAGVAGRGLLGVVAHVPTGFSGGPGPRRRWRGSGG